MRSTNGSYKIGRFEIFIGVGTWRWGAYNIATTRIIQRGPVRIFIRNGNPNS